MLALLCALALSGCHSAASDKLAQSDELAQEALRPENGGARAELSKVRSATFKNSAITGWDAQHRPAWRLQSRETRVGAGEDPAAPRRATLLEARAELFRAGVLESSFQAARIEFVSVGQSQRLALSGGVRAQSVPPPSLLKGKGSAQLKPTALTSAPVELQAPRVEVDLAAKTVFVPASAVIEQKQSHLRASSRTLRADSGLQRIDMGGDVQAASPRGRVRADRATYNWNSRRLLASGHVRAQAPAAVNGQAPTNVLLSGERLDADVEGGGGLLSGGVRAQAQGGQSGAASAAQVRFSWRARTLQAEGGASMEKDGAVLKARQISTDADFSQATAEGGVLLSRAGTTLSADRVRAFEKFTRAVAAGGVRLAASTSRGQTTMRAAQLEAFDGFTRAVATGGVVLQQGAATVRGERVQAFDLKGAGRAVARGGVQLVRDDLTVDASNLDATDLRDKGKLVVQASGGVRARTSKGRVSCERARWAGGRVEASGGVALQQKQAVLRGDSLTSDDRFQNALLTGHVRGELPAGGRVSAGRIEKAGDKIIATGGVQAQQQGVSLRVARLEATASGSDVLGSGGVLLTTSDGATLRAPSARYNHARDEAYAQDGARFVDAKQGLNLSGSSVLVRHVSDKARREAIINGGSGEVRKLRNLKL